MTDLRDRIAREIALGRSGNRPDRVTAELILANGDCVFYTPTFRG